VTAVDEIIRAATAAGLSLAARGDQLSIKPASLLSPDLRLLLVEHKAELLAFLRRPANAGPQSRICAWTVVLNNGARITAVNATGADEVEMLELACDQFGRSRVAGVRAAAPKDADSHLIALRPARRRNAG
jgi:hypothetical protein